MEKVAERHPRPGLSTMSGKSASWGEGQMPEYTPNRKSFYSTNPNGQLVQCTWHGETAEGWQVVEIYDRWISGPYTDSVVYLATQEEAQVLVDGSQTAIEKNK